MGPAQTPALSNKSKLQARPRVSALANPGFKLFQKPRAGSLTGSRHVKDLAHMKITEFLKRKFTAVTSDKKFHEILTGSAWALGARVVATILAFATSIIVARYYGEEALGVLALINSFLLLASIFTLLGTKTSILRLIPEHVAKYSVSSAFRVYRTTQWIVVVSSMLVGVIFFLGSGWLAGTAFNKVHLGPLFALAAGFTAFYSLAQFNTQAVRGLRLAQTFAVMQIVPHASMLVFVGLATVWFKHEYSPVYSQLAAWTVTALIGLTVMICVFRRRSRFGGNVHVTSPRKILSLSTPMLLTSSMQFLMAQIGIIVLGIMKSEAEVGYYSVAVKLATLTAFVLGAINSMAAPKFSHYYHSGNMDDLFHIAKKSTQLIFWSTVPILIVLIASGEHILIRLYGPDFGIGYSAMVILVIGQFVNSISGSTGYFMNMTGNQRSLRNITSVAALANVSLTILLVWKVGILGAALATTIALSCWNLSCLLFIKRKYGKTIGHVPGLRFVVDKLKTV